MNPSNLSNKRLGNKGEDIAASYLSRHGYRVIDRNFKARYGELDIICIKDNTLIFVEVKSRIGREFGLPEESVTPRKLREVVKTAEYYVLLHPGLPKLLRIDVIAIELDQSDAVLYFNHIENVSM